MKKVVIMLSLGILSVTTIMSQVLLGVKTAVDLNATKISSSVIDLNNYTQNHISWTIGLTGELPLNSNLNLASEINYTRNGFDLAEGTSFSVLGFDVPVGISSTVDLKYIEIPLLLKYYQQLNPQLDLLVEAGPSMGIGLNGIIKPQANLLFDFNLPNIPINFSDQAWNRNTLSMNLGLGLSYDITNNTKLQANIRYTSAMTDLTKPQAIDFAVKTNSINIGTGVSMAF